MPKPESQLARFFRVEKYLLEIRGSVCHLTIEGFKLPPPTKRITLHQKALKITKAEITGFDKQQPKVYEIARINYLPTFQEVRLHTVETIYPGPKKIVLEYNLSADKLRQLKQLNRLPARDLMPSIDENNTGGQASFKLIYTDGAKE